MRWAFRFALSASLLLIILLLLLKTHLEDLWDQYNVTSYIESSYDKSFGHGGMRSHPPFRGEPGDKVIIMAKLEKEDTNWVTESLPDWQSAIYTVNPTSNASAALTTPMNKGHEAMAYLSYIIDNYDDLPSTLVFLHSHRDGFFAGWHTDTPLHDNVDALRSLQLPFVQQSGYVNLRCNWNPGCLEPHRHNAHVTPQVWRDVFAGTSRETCSFHGHKEMGEEEKQCAPNQVGAACCAQFAVSKEAVRFRPLSDYTHFRDWIVETEKSDAKSGRVMEFLWHVIFGKKAVHCPAEEKCYCDVYGQC